MASTPRSKSRVAGGAAALVPSEGAEHGARGPQPSAEGLQLARLVPAGARREGEAVVALHPDGVST